VAGSYGYQIGWRLTENVKISDTTTKDMASAENQKETRFNELSLQSPW